MTVTDDNDPLQPGRDAFLRAARRVLARRGYQGDALEERLQQLLQRDASRLAAVIWGATPAEATNMTIDQRLAFIKAKQKAKQDTSRDP